MKTDNAIDGETSHSFMFKVDTAPTKGRTDVLLVDCGATSHIITDESLFKNFDQSFNSEQHHIELADGTQAHSVAKKRECSRSTGNFSRENCECNVTKCAVYSYLPTQYLFCQSCIRERSNNSV